MQHSAQQARPSDSDDRDPPASADRKRKLKHVHRSANDASKSTNQQTISDLFSTSQTKHSSPPSKDASGHPPAGTVSPRSKRLKPNPPASKSEPSPLSTDATSVSRFSTASALPPSKMYHFPSTRTNGSGSSNGSTSNVVDLTGTPSPGPSSSPAWSHKSDGAKMLRPNFNPNVGAKQLVVKNFRKKPRSDPRQYFDQTWNSLQDALSKIFNGKKIDSLEIMYRGVENVCRQGFAAELSAKLKERCRTYMETQLKKPLLDKAGGVDVETLKAVLNAWRTWSSEQEDIGRCFMFLDRSYLIGKGDTLQDQAFSLFRTIICEDPVLRPKIVQGACELVQTDRTQQRFDKDLFKSTISMFHDLAIYTNMFEPKLLEFSQQFVSEWAAKASSEMNLADYTKSVFALIDKEMSRCDEFGLDSSTKRDLLSLLEEHLVEQRVEHLVNEDAVADLLDQNAVSELERVYMLLDSRRLGAKLRPAFEKWIDLTGTAVVFDEKDQENMVVKLLTLKKQLDTVWRVSFHRNTELGHGLRESFEAFINKSKKTNATWNTDNSKPGEMIAKYVDMLLRGGAKAIPAQLSAVKSGEAERDENDDNVLDEDAEINSQLDQVLDLFRFVHGKAVFEAFYKKDLARRLLMGRSASADAERSMLARLKTECGAGFTQNLEQMFKDIELAREEMSSYKSLLEERGEKPSVDLSVNILSASSWPTYPDIPVIIPPEIQQALDKFTVHYKSKHSGRKLDWKHALVHCQLKATFPKGNKELVVSGFQAIVLLLFNNVKTGEHLSYEFLKAETGLPERELKRTLQSLACAKLRPLMKHPKGRDINPEDTFTYNAAFTHEKYRLKVNQVQLKETKEENKETHERVAADRNFETQAAIVRIMKSRKRIGHAELVAEVINATKKRGVLSVQDIKKNIDRLVDKDYMEREENNEYSYIA
ncbi:Cullin family-domain-containing protein [Phyllosticta paracitricarpa]|uniref:Cullin family-domain-containing protein n=1 Tax=Phyllosticta paracitricarpa TaxID=2016321 RepID=A0ABR1MZ67_9PEZI